MIKAFFLIVSFLHKRYTFQCHKNTIMRFGNRIRVEREKNNLSALALAELCEVSRSYITLIENNKRLPGRKIIPRLALALNVRTNIVINWYLEDIREKIQ